MERRGANMVESRYGKDAAVYQPSQGELRRTIGLVFLLLTVLLIGIATRAHAEGKASERPALEGRGHATGLWHDPGKFRDGVSWGRYLK